MSQRVPLSSSSKPFQGEGKEKSSINSAFPDFSGREGEEDPKPSELAMARVNPAEMREEARTREPFNTLG